MMTKMNDIISISPFGFLYKYLRHFLNYFVGSKPQTAQDSAHQNSEGASPDPNLYTVRVYRSPPETNGDRLVIICISLHCRLYVKVCSIQAKVKS